MDENMASEMQAAAESFTEDLKSGAAPSLVFGEEAPAEEAQAQAQPQTAEESLATSDILSEEEKRQVADFSKKIDITNTKAILEYGGGVQKKMADFSEDILQNVKTHDLGEVGNMLSGVIGDLQEFNPNEEESKGFLGLFKKSPKKMTELKANYDRASVNVDKVAQALKAHQVKLLKDVDMLDKMYSSNLDYYKNLTMYILAGKEKLKEVRATTLAEAQAKAQRTGLAEDAQKAKDIEDQCLRFEKKIHDLELTRMVALQTGPQIRMIQNNDTLMVEKIQTSIVNTIPLWKSQMVLALGMSHSQQAMKAQREVTNVTNELLQKNAQTLHQGSVAIAKESERGIVDLETLRKTNEELIATLNEVRDIQDQGRVRRAQAEEELGRLEGALKQKLLEMKG